MECCTVKKYLDRLCGKTRKILQSRYKNEGLVSWLTSNTVELDLLFMSYVLLLLIKWLTKYFLY